MNMKEVRETKTNAEAHEISTPGKWRVLVDDTSRVHKDTCLSAPEENPELSCIYFIEVFTEYEYIKQSSTLPL